MIQAEHQTLPNFYECLQETKDGVYLNIRLTPRARKNQIFGIISSSHGPALKISLNAPPIDGRANQALLLFLSEVFAIALRRISIQRGAQSREKKILLQGASIELVYSILEKGIA